MNVAALLAEGFVPVGEWRTPECRVHRVDSIKRKPGLYAFVVDGDVRYIGKANILHRRLRNYSNRCFREGSRQRRACHSEIIDAINRRQTVSVYVKLADGVVGLAQMEGELISKFRPAWNRTHGITCLK